MSIILKQSIDNNSLHAESVYKASIEQHTTGHKLFENSSNTPKRRRSPSRILQCAYHFSQPSHICLTCRKTICVRCAHTYCINHVVCSQEKLLPSLKNELLSEHVVPFLDQASLRLHQTQQRKSLACSRVNAIIDKVENEFEYVIARLIEKKNQIVQHYRSQLNQEILKAQQSEQRLQARIQWLKILQSNKEAAGHTIEEIDLTKYKVSENLFTDQWYQQIFKPQFSVPSWSEYSLEKVLYEVAKIPFDEIAKATSPSHKSRLRREPKENKISPFTLAAKPTEKSIEAIFH